jgi:hypothetical protein
MVLAFTRKRADLNAPISAVAEGGVIQTLYAIITISGAPVATNTIDVGYLPRDAIVVGGYYGAADLDTGTGVLDMDLGIAANGVDSADPDFFMNAGAMPGTPLTDFNFTNAAVVRMLTGPFPVTRLGAKTLVQLLCNTAANVFTAGDVVVCIQYITPGAVSSPP